jgi:hypothetical protein
MINNFYTYTNIGVGEITISEKKKNAESGEWQRLALSWQCLALSGR